MNSDYVISLGFILIATGASGLCILAIIEGSSKFFLLGSSIISFISCCLSGLFLWKICKSGW